MIAALLFRPLAVQHANYAASGSGSLWAWISHSKETSTLEPSMAMNHRIRHPRGIYFWSLRRSPGTPTTAPFVHHILNRIVSFLK